MMVARSLAGMKKPGRILLPLVVSILVSASVVLGNETRGEFSGFYNDYGDSTVNSTSLDNDYAGEAAFSSGVHPQYADLAMSTNGPSMGQTALSAALSSSSGNPGRLAALIAVPSADDLLTHTRDLVLGLFYLTKFGYIQPSNVSTFRQAEPAQARKSNTLGICLYSNQSI
jgi:hypothetical protein